MARGNQRDAAREKNQKKLAQKQRSQGKVSNQLTIPPNVHRNDCTNVPPIPNDDIVPSIISNSSDMVLFVENRMVVLNNVMPTIVLP